MPPLLALAGGDEILFGRLRSSRLRIRREKRGCDALHRSRYATRLAYLGGGLSGGGCGNAAHGELATRPNRVAARTCSSWHGSVRYGAASTNSPDRTPDESDGRPSSTVLDRTFRVSIVIKGLDGALEIIGGLLLLFVSPATIQGVVHSLTQHELSQDPHDFIARHLVHSVQGLSHFTTLFAAIYLLSHGLAKVVLVIAVLRDQIWAYPAIIVLLLGFIAYQLYRLVLDPTIPLILLTLFDAFVVVLTWREYQEKHGHRRGTAPAAERDRCG